MAAIKWNDTTKDKLVKTLVEDFDASEHLAQEAVVRFASDVEPEEELDFENFEDLAEHVHDTQSYWED